MKKQFIMNIIPNHQTISKIQQISLINNICPCPTTFFHHETNINAQKALLSHKFNDFKSNKISLKKKKNLKIISSKSSKSYSYYSPIQRLSIQPKNKQVISQIYASSQLINLRQPTLHQSNHSLDMEKTNSSQRNNTKFSGLKIMLKSDQLTDELQLTSVNVISNTLTNKSSQPLKVFSKFHKQQQSIPKIQISSTNLDNNNMLKQMQNQVRRENSKQQQNQQVIDQEINGNHKLQSIQQLQSKIFDSDKSIQYSLSDSQCHSNSIQINIMPYSSPQNSFIFNKQNQIYSDKIMCKNNNYQPQIHTCQLIRQNISFSSSNSVVKSKRFLSNFIQQQEIYFQRKGQKNKTFHQQLKVQQSDIQIRKVLSQNNEPINNHLLSLDNLALKNVESVVTQKNFQEKQMSEVLSCKPLIFGNQSTNLLGIQSLTNFNNIKNCQNIISFKKQPLYSQKIFFQQKRQQFDIQYQRNMQRNSSYQK